MDIDTINQLKKQDRQRYYPDLSMFSKEVNVQKLHTGTHPITEVKCDDPKCWCNTSQEIVTEWSKCIRCGMRVDGGKDEYQKHLDNGECTRQLIYELVQSVHRMEENISTVVSLAKYQIREIVRGDEEK